MMQHEGFLSVVTDTDTYHLHLHVMVLDPFPLGPQLCHRELQHIALVLCPDVFVFLYALPLSLNAVVCVLSRDSKQIHPKDLAKFNTFYILQTGSSVAQLQYTRLTTDDYKEK